MMVGMSAELLLRRVFQGALNGMTILPYEYRGERQPWQVALRDRILAEVAGQEAPDVVVPGRHSR
jgi:hypothetical protein